MYGKIFDSIYDGTLRTNWQALVTFQQLIILADKSGVVDMTPHAIHGRTGIPMEIIEAGIEQLINADVYSLKKACGADDVLLEINPDHVYMRMLFPEEKRLPVSQWRPIRLAVFRRDNYTCQYCKKRGLRLECDHVTPISRGGDNDISNLVSACIRCNRSKGSKLLEDWIQ